jgi:hypothetical protein
LADPETLFLEGDPMICQENCADCGKPVSLTDIKYVGYNFHRRCFIKRISKHCGEAKRNEIFENHGITPEEVSALSNRFASACH